MRRPLCLIAAIFVLALFAAAEAAPPPDGEGFEEWDGERIILIGTVEDMTWPCVQAASLPENAADMPGPAALAASEENKSYKEEPEAVLDLSNLNLVQNGSESVGEEFQTYSNQIKSHQKLHIICYLKDYESGWKPKIGERVRVEGKVRLFRRATNPGEFDAAGYYRNRGYLFQMTDGRITGGAKGYSVFRQFLYRIKTAAAQILDTYFSEQDASVLKAMLLGDKKGMDQGVKELYQKAGIAHVLAISGLHVSLLGLGVYRLLKKGRLPSWIAAGVSTLLLFSFIVMTGFSPSSLRAFTMFLLSMGALMCGRTYDSPTALCTAAAVCLAGRPLYLYDAGFRLSFAAAAGAVFTAPALKSLGNSCQGNFSMRNFFKQNLFKQDFFKQNVPMRNSSIGSQSMGNSESGLRMYAEKWIKVLFNAVREAFTASLGISLTSLPVMLWAFSEFNCLSVVVNCLVIPLMSLLMGGVILVVCLGAGAAVLSGTAFTGIVGIAALPIKGILRIYERAAGLTAASGLGIWHAGCPEVWQTVVFCGGLLLLILFAKKINKAAGTVILTALCAVFAVSPSYGTELTMLDVGQGDCFFLKTQTNHCYLIDAGSTSKKDTGDWQVVPFLKYRGVSRLEGIFISHWDEDHVNGLEAVCRFAKEEGVGIGRILLPDTAIEDEALSRLLETARLYGIRTERMKRGDCLKDGGTTIACLHPYPDEKPADRNASSMVLKLTCKAGENESFSALLTGDIEAEGEEWMLTEEAEMLKDCDLLKAAHHGSDTSTGQAFADCVSPSIVLVSCGKDNRYGHPSPTVISRLESAGSRIYVTKDCGAVTVRIIKNKVTVKPFLQVD